MRRNALDPLSLPLNLPGLLTNALEEELEELELLELWLGAEVLETC